jgi:hypothetical protein
MESIVRKAVGALEACHDVQVLNRNLGSTLADAVQYRHHNKTVPLFVHIDSEVAVIGSGDRAHCGIRPEVPRLFSIAGPVEDFYKRLPFVELFVEVE